MEAEIHTFIQPTGGRGGHMNITSCPQCGGRVRSVSIGWKCEGCNGFIDMSGQFHEHKDKPFMPPMTNAERIRAMSDERMAITLVKHCGTETHTTRFGGHEHIFYGPNGEKCDTKAEAVGRWALWLKQSAGED